VPGQDGHSQHDGPQAEHHFHLAEKVQELREDARLRPAALARGRLVVIVLHAMGERREARHGKRVDNGQDEDGGGDQVERVLRRPLHKRREEAVRRRRRVGRQRCRQQRDRRGGWRHGLQ
jgi:hypothetical protein